MVSNQELFGEKMNVYTPDRWIVVEFVETGSEPIRKVLAGWYGGYCGSDRWKLSSGIVDVQEDENKYVFKTASGSIYQCSKGAFGMSGLMSDHYEYWSNHFKSEEIGSVEIVAEYEPK